MGNLRDPARLGVAISDFIIVLEMPIFAVAYHAAFRPDLSRLDQSSFKTRLPIVHAIKDAFSFVDIVRGGLSTMTGAGINYRDFEPVTLDGPVHAGGSNLNRRAQAGLRYANGGQVKYWIDPSTGSEAGSRPGSPLSPGREESWAAFNFDEEAIRMEIESGDEEEWECARRFLYGDLNYPVIDMASEHRRQRQRELEDSILTDRIAAASLI